MNGSLKLIMLLMAVCAIVYFRGMRTINQRNPANGSQRRGQMTVVFHGSPTNTALPLKSDSAK